MIAREHCYASKKTDLINTNWDLECMLSITHDPRTFPTPPAIPRIASFFCCSSLSGYMCTRRWYELGIVNAPKIPPSPRTIRKPNLLVVTKELIKDMTPRPVNPSSNMITAEKRSDRRPANRRNEANVREYDVRIWINQHMIVDAYVSREKTHPCQLTET